MTKTLFIRDFLNKRIITNQKRHLRLISAVNGVEIQYQGRSLINFCSNNYLGLTEHSLLKKRAIAFVERYGTGSGSSRLVCGNHAYHAEIESILATLMGTESALLFNSGYQANSTLLPALADKYSLILADRQNHNSLVHGAMSSGATVMRYRHSDLNHLEELLQKHTGKYSRIWIVSETTFSMDGDCTDVDALIALAERYHSLLYLDDAHATGIFGQNGMGLCAGKRGIDIAMGGFGKGCGAFGAFACCSSEMREYLLQACPGFIYTTALPPAVIGAVSAALELIPKLDAARNELHQNSEWMRSKLNELNYDTGISSSHIIPIILGSETEALELADWLEQHGILAVAIRPPTVPAGTSRLRLSLTTQHKHEHLQRLSDVLHSWQQKKCTKR